MLDGGRDGVFCAAVDKVSVLYGAIAARGRSESLGAAWILVLGGFLYAGGIFASGMVLELGGAGQCSYSSVLVAFRASSRLAFVWRYWSCVHEPWRATLRLEIDAGYLQLGRKTRRRVTPSTYFHLYIISTTVSGISSVGR